MQCRALASYYGLRPADRRACAAARLGHSLISNRTILASNDSSRGGDPIVGVVMGSSSDWPTMQHAADCLAELGVPHESRVVSAHRTPELLRSYAQEAEGRGLRAIIAGAGGAAHLPGMLAAWTHVPVLGVPVESRVLKGVDSLLSIVQMPGGVPVATFAIGKAGARNAALFAGRLLAPHDAAVRARLETLRAAAEEKARNSELS